MRQRTLFTIKTCLLMAILTVLTGCTATSSLAGPRHELRALYKLPHREFASYVVTGPEVRQRVLRYILLFHSRDIRKVRRILDTKLTNKRGWDVSIDTPGRFITYDYHHTSVAYMSAADYNYRERGINNPGWYPDGPPVPKAYPGGCVVEYFTTKK